MRSIVVLLNVEGVVLKFDYCSFVVIDITVVGCGKHCDDCGELGLAVPFVQLVAVELSFVSADDGKKLVSL